ncbi:MAG: hypothetical protein AAB583_02645, partial [Patescibacteria group bacterium]
FGLSKEVSFQYLNILISLLSSGVGGRLKLAQDIAKNKDEIIPWVEKMILVTRQLLIEKIMRKYKNNVFTSSFLGVPLSGTTPQSLTAIRDSGQARMTDYEIASRHLNILISLQKTYVVLKTTNVNPRLALENLFLNL